MITDIKQSQAYKYATFAANDKDGKVPKYVKMQAQQWKDIADNKKNRKLKNAYICEKTFKKIESILSLMMHPDLNKPLSECLEDYAAFFIFAVFTTKTIDEDTGLECRYYTTAVLEIARKNYKTFNSGVIFVIMMLTEPINSRFFSVAPTLDLSMELRIAIKKIIKGSPELYDDLDPAFKILGKQIKCLLNDNEYTPLAYSNDKMDGKLANCFLADEVGALDAYPIEAMRSSQIGLMNELGIIISTQYPNTDNALKDEIDISKKTLDGLIDTRYFALLYEPDEQYKNETSWKTEDRILYQSNPVTINNKRMFKKLCEKRTMAIVYDDKRENFLCKHCNIQYRGLGAQGFIDSLKFKKCRIEEDIEFWKGKRVFVGLDLSESDDNTAIAMLTEVEDVIYAKVWGFIPADRIDIKSQKEHLNYKQKIEAGECFACGDEVISYAFVEDFIMDLQERYGVEVVQVGYDKWNARSTAQKLEAAGYECVEVKQHSSVLHPPTKLLYEKILKKKFKYESNTLLEINAENAKCTKDTNGNKYINKKQSNNKVDMIMAILDALYLLQQEEFEGVVDIQEG